MQFGRAHVNPYLYQHGGRIDGDYMYIGSTKIRMKNTADIELAIEEARIQQEGDEENYLCFQPDLLYIAKALKVHQSALVEGDLQVGGTIHTGDIEMSDLHVKGDATIDGTLTVPNQSNLGTLGVSGALSVTGATDVKAIAAESLQVSGHTNLNQLVVNDTVTHDLTATNLTTTNLTTTDLTATDVAISHEMTVPDVRSERVFATLGFTGGSLDVTGDSNLSRLTTDGPNLLKGVSFIPDLSSSDFHTNSATVQFDVSSETLSTSGLATLHKALIPSTLEVQGKSTLGEVEVTQSLDVSGATTLKAVLADSLTVTGRTNMSHLTIQDLHTTNLYAAELKSDMVFNTHLTGAGSITISTGPTDHEVHIGYDRIELTDHNPTHGGHIKLDVSTGEIQCNGGIKCFNDNPATNLLNPRGVLTDFVQTQAHRSDFGMNAAGESLTASGSVKALSFRLTTAPGLPDLGGILPTYAFHQISMVTRSMYASHYYSQDQDESSVHIDMENNDIDLNVKETTLVNIHETGSRFFKKVTFSNADELDFSGLDADQIKGWPIEHPEVHEIKHAKDITNGVRICSDDTQQHSGELEAAEVRTVRLASQDATFGMDGVGVVDFKDVAELDFTGLDADQIKGWPIEHPEVHEIKHAKDISTGVRICSDATQQNAGHLEAADVTTVRLGSQHATFGVDGAGVVDFGDVAELDFTGLDAHQVKGWPLSHPGGLHNIQDSENGVKVDGTLECAKVRTDFIEPSTEQILRLSGFDQVRVSNNLNVLGSSVLQETFADHLHCATATFTHEVTFNTTTNQNVANVNELRVKNTDLYGGCPQYINLQYHEADQTTAFLKCYLGGNQDSQKMSLGYDGMYIGDGLAFREDRKTRIFRRSTTTATGVEDRFVTYVNDQWVSTMASDRAVFDVRVMAPNVKSSGSFSHCHVCEPAEQDLAWGSLTGRLVESTGQCAVRDDAGVLVSDFKQVPGLSYAMPSVQVAESSVLGVLLSVEEVQDGSIEHAHGIVLSHKVAEPDGHKVLRVCGAGDCMVWVVRPLASEVPLTSSQLGGLYTKFENGIEQSEKIVMTCNDDFSFQWIVAGTVENALAVRVAQLEAMVNMLTNQQ